MCPLQQGRQGLSAKQDSTLCVSLLLVQILAVVKRASSLRSRACFGPASGSIGRLRLILGEKVNQTKCDLSIFDRKDSRRSRVEDVGRSRHNRIEAPLFHQVSFVQIQRAWEGVAERQKVCYFMLISE